MMISTAEAATMCPKCGGDGFVKKTYINDSGARIRIRKCDACGYRYRTREVLWEWPTARGKK